ncbi:MAG TPA: DUF488 family protein [Fimbriimonas sp.]|nr:DUF488 family protein [Fimbriimonas sp.]
MQVYTIGHGQTDLTEFLDTLSKHRITHVIDVRLPADAVGTGEYHPESISMELLVRGIRYANMGESLGAHAHISLDECERVRGSEEYRAGFMRLMQAAMDEDRMLCLLGIEPKAERCHRSKLVGESLARARGEVTHIEGDEITLHSAVMARLAQRAYAEDDLRGPRTSIRS